MYDIYISYTEMNIENQNPTLTVNLLLPASINVTKYTSTHSYCDISNMECSPRWP